MSQKPLRYFTIFSLGFCLLVSHLNGGENRPNFVFIIADDMYRYMLNALEEGDECYLTPNLDRLSREGVVFSNTLATSPVCTPSRFSCLTGNYASRAENKEFVEDWRKWGQTYVKWNTFIVSETENIASILRQHGYHTGFVGKNHVIWDAQRTHLSFTDKVSDPEVQYWLTKNTITQEAAIRACGFDYAAACYDNNPWSIGPEELAVHNMDWIAKGGVDFIREYSDRPFYLYFAATTPHGPNEPERSWNANPLATADGYLEEPIELLPDRQTIPSRLEQADVVRSNEAANLLWMDDAIGALLDALEGAGVLESTYIIFFNDHNQESKGTLYQGGVNSFCIVWKDGGFADLPQVSSDRIANIDFVPTILEFAGMDPGNRTFDGQSFAPLLKGEKLDLERAVFLEMGFTRAVIKGDWKYLVVNYPESVQNWTLEQRMEALEAFNAPRRITGQNIVNEGNPDLPFSHLEPIPGGGDAEKDSTGKKPGYYDRHQLYHLVEDPGEMNNLAAVPEFESKLKEMQELMQDFVTDLPGDFAGFSRNQQTIHFSD